MRGNLRRIVALLIILSIVFTLTPSALQAKKLVKVKGLTISKPIGNSLTLGVGQKYKIKASVSPKNASNKKLIFQVNAKGIVSVSADGTVKAKKQGRLQ